MGDRTKAGGSDNSYRKHQVVRYISRSQGNAFGVHHSRARKLLIDTNAGNGQGVDLPQGYLQFDEDVFVNRSKSSARVLAELSLEIGADLIVCEKDPALRESLRKEITAIVPSAIILDDNERLLDMNFDEYDWVFVISDPCGYNGKEIRLEVLQHIARRVKSDFLFILNRAAWDRLMAMKDEGDPSERAQTRGVRLSKQKHGWMTDPKEWAVRLGRKCAALTRAVKKQSGNYGPQFIVVANYFGGYISNSNKWDIYEVNK